MKKGQAKVYCSVDFSIFVHSKKKTCPYMRYKAVQRAHKSLGTSQKFQGKNVSFAE